MADVPRNPETEDAGAAPDRAAPPGIPRWLKVSGIVVIVLIVIAVGVSLIFGMEHGPGQFGPGQHGPGSDAGSDPAGSTSEVNGLQLAAIADELAFATDRS
jgi:hypothetical protein